PILANTGWTARNSAAACCTRPGSPRCRAWISARPTPAAPCVFPMPPAWTACARPSTGWAHSWERSSPSVLGRQPRGQRDAAAFGQHPGAVAAVAGPGRAHIAGQAALYAAAATDAIPQDLRPDAHVDHRIEDGRRPAAGSQLGPVHARHDLHQALRADGTFD